MAQGVVHSVAGSPTAALSELTRAAALLESSHRAALLPDTPAALAALVAVHCGELDVAQSVLERAIRVRLGGRGHRRPAPAAAGLDRAVPRGDAAAARAALSHRGRPRSSPATSSSPPRWRWRSPGAPVISPRSCPRGAGRGRRSCATPSTCSCCSSWASSSVAAARLRETSWVRPAPRRGRRAAGPPRQPGAVGGAPALVGAAGGDRGRVPRRRRRSTRPPSSRRRAPAGTPQRSPRPRPHWVGDARRRGRRRGGGGRGPRAARRRAGVGGRQARRARRPSAPATAKP